MSPDSSSPVLHVVAGVVIDAQGRVLIAQRPAGKHMAGGWEFPGGKLEPGEGRLAGLARELREELGITIGLVRPLIRVRHTYPSREVLLDIWVIKQYSGVPDGRDGQALRWCTQDELEAAELLPADKPIVAALRLPERLTQLCSDNYVIRNAVRLDCSSMGEGDHYPTRLCGMFCKDAAEAVLAAGAGAGFLAMREGLPSSELAGLCQSVSVPIYVHGLTLEHAWALGASGVHGLI